MDAHIFLSYAILHPDKRVLFQGHGLAAVPKKEYKGNVASLCVYHRNRVRTSHRVVGSGLEREFGENVLYHIDGVEHEGGGFVRIGRGRGLAMVRADAVLREAFISVGIQMWQGERVRANVGGHIIGDAWSVPTAKPLLSSMESGYRAIWNRVLLCGIFVKKIQFVPDDVSKCAICPHLDRYLVRGRFEPVSVRNGHA